MTTNPDAVWANRPVKAILLIRILGLGFSLGRDSEIPGLISGILA